MEKEDYFKIFTDLVADQFRYGGVKYGDPKDKTKETTDTLFDTHGSGWLYGTMHKYCFRFINVKRERDLLKIATYAYILWLKRGYFVHVTGINDPPINTTVKIKLAEFEPFMEKVQKQKDDSEESSEFALEAIGNQLSKFSAKSITGWSEIKEQDIIRIFLRAYRVWYLNFKDNAGKDTDTWNKGDVKA